MRPKIDLEPYKDEIISLYQDHTLQEVCMTINDRHSLNVTPTTTKKRLRSWGVQENAPLHTVSNESHSETVKDLVFNVGLDDRTIQAILKEKGHPMSLATIKRIRAKLGIVRRIDASQEEDQINQMHEVLRTEIQTGRIEGYGREFLYEHIRKKGYLFN